MAADIVATVRDCGPCSRNRVRLRKRTHPLKLFPAVKPLEDVAIDILGPLPRTENGHRYILVIADRFTKLTQAVPLSSTTAAVVAAAFVDEWVFKYGVPRTLLADNGKQFSSQFFRGVSQLLGITNTFTSAYHPQTNGMVERFNRSIVNMLRNYVNDHQDDWDQYVRALTFAYNCGVHRSTGTTPFDLVLSRKLPDLAIRNGENGEDTPITKDRRPVFLKRLEQALGKARSRLEATEQRYKRDFDRRVRRSSRKIAPGSWVYLDPRDGTTAPKNKLAPLAEGPHQVLANDDNTFVIQRGADVERVNADRVVPAPTPAHAQQMHELAATPADLAEKNTRGPEYLFETILDHRVTRGQNVEFLVKWSPPFEPDWQPRQNVPEEAIARYFKKARTGANAQRRTPQ